MLARVCGGSSAPAWVMQCALRALFPRLPGRCLLPALAPQEERTEGELVACLHRDWLLQEPPQPAVTVGREEGEVCVLSRLLARRNACAWGLLHALLPC